MLAIPVREQVVGINAFDGMPAWKYENTEERAWTCVWIVSGNGQFLAGFEAHDMEKVIRFNKMGKILETGRSKEFASKPVWVEDRWWRMTETEFFADDAGFEIPKSKPIFIHAGGLFIYQTTEGIVEARNANGTPIWSWAPDEDNPHGIFTDIGWCIAFVTSDTLYAVDKETGGLLWEREAKVSVMPKPTDAGLMYAEGKNLIQINREGEEFEVMETRWNALDFETADDGVAVLHLNRLITYDHGWNILEDYRLNPKIDELFVLPGKRLAVCGYSQTFFESVSE